MEAEEPNNSTATPPTAVVSDEVFPLPRISEQGAASAIFAPRQSTVERKTVVKMLADNVARGSTLYDDVSYKDTKATDIFAASVANKMTMIQRALNKLKQGSQLDKRKTVKFTAGR